MPRLWRFAHDWLVPASVEDVYAVCAAVDAYPTWWREIRSIERVDAESGWAEVRSVLPYTLRMLITREVEDEATGRLRVRLEGDLTGWAEFRVSPSAKEGANSVAAVAFRQEVEVTAPLLGRVAPALAPALRANHAWMMRSCRDGMLRALG
ncbi:SRPBCC family protein [Knoellia subterranea]|uniref:Polyketide cyclase n=1 Tax=Knoellia subterranea KCTC 19937 TaxID=1385521 RepID=A0A0A0JRD0_9MICO|nr:SRPBCC family protein [Knoellia subterranea]KGN38141.1 polyketide cyclase [Knoellia subterranea KCTC 19937]